MSDFEYRFTGRVEATGKTTGGNRWVVVKVDDGSKYGARVKFWTTDDVESGQTITVTGEQAPFLQLDQGRVPTYMTRDGVEKIDTKLTYPHAHIEGADSTDEIPF